MGDTVIVAYFNDPGSPEMISADMWLDRKIPSTVLLYMYAGREYWTLHVAMPDYDAAIDYLSLWEQQTWDYMFKDEFEARKNLDLTENPFSVDASVSDIDSFLQGETLSNYSTDPRELALKVARNIHKVLGDNAAKRLIDTFEQFSSPKEDVQPPKVSIVILMHNKWQHTKRCLWSLFDTTDISFELVLVDNGSTDADVKNGLTEYLNECLLRHVPARLLTFNENVGAVRGRNEALPSASADYILFMDNDVVVRRRNWLKRMVGFLDANPKYGAVGPKLIYPNEPHLIQCAGCDVSPTGRVNFRGRGEPIDAPEFNKPRDMQCLISACILFPRRVVERVGKLDMAYHPVQFEDIDYCYRIREAGFKIRYLPDVEVYHFENVTTGGTRQLNYSYLTVKNGKVFKDKWHSMYSNEDGPVESSMIWKDIPSVDIKSIGKLALLD